MWGATKVHDDAVLVLHISIRAPLCGVRLPQNSTQIASIRFQSAHPYVGCDSYEEALANTDDDISIRAPLCGVRRTVH